MTTLRDHDSRLHFQCFLDEMKENPNITWAELRDALKCVASCFSVVPRSGTETKTPILGNASGTFGQDTKMNVRSKT